MTTPTTLSTADRVALNKPEKMAKLFEKALKSIWRRQFPPCRGSRGLMLVLRGGGAVFRFGYLYEPHSGASGARDTS